MVKNTIMSIDDPREAKIIHRCQEKKHGVMIGNKCKKTGDSLNYKESDFKIIKGFKKTGDTRMPFIFKSKDGEIEANVFNEPGNVEIRALIGDTSNRGGTRIAYPFAYTSDPKPEKFLSSFVRALNRGNWKSE
jgi:hypothetical protein